MSKISNIKKISLSTVLISVLAGCGGGGGGTSTSASSGSSVESRSLQYESCVDLNQNAVCENSEKGLNPADYPNIAVTSKENNGKYLIGPSNSDEVSAWSTLVYNEMKYNPLVNKDQTSAISYLKTNLGVINRSLDNPLTKEQSQNFEQSLKIAIENNPLVNKNSIIAAVCEKFISNKGSNVVSISTTDAQKQFVVLNDVKIEKLDSKNWDNIVNTDLIGEIRDSVDQELVDKQGGEKIVSISGNSNFVVTASKYHNALNVVNYNESNPTYKYNKFAAFRVNYEAGATGGTITTPVTSAPGGGTVGGGSTGGGDVISGGSARSRSINTSTFEVREVSSKSKFDTDNKKGLWEHLLESAEITENGEYVYALIRSKDESVSFPDESTYGLFKVKVETHGVLAYDNESTIRIPSKDIKKFKLSKTTNKVMVYGQVENDKDEKQNIFRVLDHNLNLLKAVEIDDLNDFTTTYDDRNIIASIKGSYTSNAKIVKYATDSLVKSAEVEVDFEIDNIFTFAYGTMAIATNKSLNKIVLINLETMKVEQEKQFDISANEFAVSQDGKYLAVGSDDKINIYNLNTPAIALQNSIEIDTTDIIDDDEDEKNIISHISFISNDKIAIKQKQVKNGFDIYKITDTKQAMTVNKKLETALNTLDKYSLNNGTDFDKITRNMNLIPSYKDVNFTYNTSNLRLNIDTTTGEITRDETQNVTGVLNVVAQTTFRNEITTKDKSFNLTILKAAPKISDSIEKISVSDTQNVTGEIRKIISNSDASTVLVYRNLDNYIKGFNVLKVENNALVFTDKDENSVNRLLRDDLLNMTFKDDNSLIIATVNKNYPGFSSIYVQDITADNTLEEGFNTTNLNKVIIGNKGTPLSASFSKDKTKVIVIRKHFDFEDADFYADVYKVVGNTVSLDRSLRMQANETYLNNEPAINEDGTVFYHLAKNKIYKQEGESIISVALTDVENIYYHNNNVFATTSTGEIVSFDKNLSAESKKVFDLNNSINKLSFAQNEVYAFTKGDNAGVYILNVDSLGTLTESKFSQKANILKGAVSSDSNHIFAYDKKAFEALKNRETSLYYIKK
ncbi:hypothetical protein ACOJTA_02380 [Malaciobacter sp. WC5094]